MDDLYNRIYQTQQNNATIKLFEMYLQITVVFALAGAIEVMAEMGYFLAAT